MKHKHAELMLAYAQDAQETETPWERWQYTNQHTDGWESLNNNPAWKNCTEYRRKPQTIRIGNYDVPEPLRVAPKVGTCYYMPSFGNETGCDVYNYDSYFDQRVLERGMMHLTREAAELHAKALISLTEKS